MTELERRLKPVLPQVVPEVNEEPRNNAQGNLCPLARTLETQSFRINEMTEDVRRILDDLRI